VSAADDPHAFGRTRLAFADQAEVDEFVTTLSKFEKGEIGPDDWRRFRLLRGIYPQRQDDLQMVRVKIPQGILTADQLRALAEVARQHSRGFGHITTRQNVQFHFVPQASLEPLLRRLAQAGLTTREACGNSVRNATACPFAGVAADEVFDVTPYALALTRYFLGHPLSSALPRKFKIAWEGCATDHALLAIHDLGFRAILDEDGRRGFRVTVGGGTSILCRSAAELVPFLPAAEVLRLAQAVLQVFHELGDFEHRQRNRLKFLIQTLGFDAFRERVNAAWDRVRDDAGPRLPFDAERPPVEEPPSGPRPVPPTVGEIAARLAAEELRGPGIVPSPQASRTRVAPDADAWRRTNLRPQKQEGVLTAMVTVPLGDLTAGQMDTLADLALAFGDGTVRTTSEQDLVLRWLSRENVDAFYQRLAAAGLGTPNAEGLADLVSCPGAESCRLAVTHSRGLGRFLGDFLRGRPDLVAVAPGLRLRMSGCPNGCGRHHVADIGFQGSVRKLGAAVVPQYFVTVGGGVIGDDAVFGRIVAKIPARRIPLAVERLIGLYTAGRHPGEGAGEFLRRVEIDKLKAALQDLAALTAAEVTPEDLVDLGEEQTPSLEPAGLPG
jgi:sulfite reductase beta subunit-like hemoprotein